MKKLGLAAILSMASFGTVAAPITTDIITMVDLSGSMSTEHAWLKGAGVITDLDNALAATAAPDPLSAQYGLVGFGGTGSKTPGHQIDVNGGEFGNAAQFGTAANGLTASGGFEDGYSAISKALSYNLRSNAVTNLILVTDEDRDTLSGSTLTKASISAALAAENALLNAVLNVTIKCGDGSKALGVDYKGTGYVANGSGGYTSCTGATVVSGYGSSKADYADLAVATKGAVWDLNQLRAGGNTADSFTLAFTDIKVQETITHTVSEPGAFALFGLSLASFGFVSRKKRLAKKASS